MGKRRTMASDNRALRLFLDVGRRRYFPSDPGNWCDAWSDLTGPVRKFAIAE